MYNSNKRRTLKILSVTPFMSIPLLASNTGLVYANTVRSNVAASEWADNSQYTGMPLEIQILDTTAVPDNNVLIRNSSDEQLIINRFVPGHIYFNDQIMDLNEAVGNAPLLLKAGQSKAFDFKLWPVVNAGPVEYVWADHVVENLNDNTSVVTLSAFMADTNAIVHSDTKNSIVS